MISTMQRGLLKDCILLVFGTGLIGLSLRTSPWNRTSNMEYTWSLMWLHQGIRHPHSYCQRAWLAANENTTLIVNFLFLLQTLQRFAIILLFYCFKNQKKHKINALIARLDSYRFMITKSFSDPSGCGVRGFNRSSSVFLLFYIPQKY